MGRNPQHLTPNPCPLSPISCLLSPVPYGTHAIIRVAMPQLSLVKLGVRYDLRRTWHNKFRSYSLLLRDLRPT